MKVRRQGFPDQGLSVQPTGGERGIVKKIVNVYGGDVGVESTLSSGATFYFTLPKNNKVIGGDG